MMNVMPEVDLLRKRETARTAASRRPLTGLLLIAGPDDEATSGALRVAELLARRDRVNAHVLSLVQPVPFTAPLLPPDT